MGRLLVPSDPQQSQKSPRQSQTRPAEPTVRSQPRAQSPFPLSYFILRGLHNLLRTLQEDLPAAANLPTFQNTCWKFSSAPVTILPPCSSATSVTQSAFTQYFKQVLMSLVVIHSAVFPTVAVTKNTNSNRPIKGYLWNGQELSWLKPSLLCSFVVYISFSSDSADVVLLSFTHPVFRVSALQQLFLKNEKRIIQLTEVSYNLGKYTFPVCIFLSFFFFFLRGKMIIRN